jgi:hypothetical protein
VLRIARQAMEGLADLERCVRDSRALLEQAKPLRQAALSATSTNKAEAKVREMRKLVPPAEAVPRRAEAALKSARAGAQKAQELARTAVKDRAEKRQREAEAARLKAEADQKQQAAEAHATLVKQETATVGEIAKELRPLVRKNNFEEAVKQATAKVAALETAEGKKSAKDLIDRYSSLAGLKTYLIERLNAGRLSWGWTEGRRSEDVLGAETKGVKLTGRIVPWEQVSPTHMLVFIRRFADSRDVSARVLAEQNLAAAVYCFENGSPDLAAQFAAKAVELKPSMDAEVKRLMPPEDAPQKDPT